MQLVIIMVVDIIHPTSATVEIGQKKRMLCDSSERAGTNEYGSVTQEIDVTNKVTT